MPQQPFSHNLRATITFLIVSTTYFATAQLGLLMASINQNASPVWPATGVAIVSLWICGVRFWPAIALGAFAANALTGTPVIVNLTIAAGNSLEAIAGFHLLKYFMLNKERFTFQSEPLAVAIVSMLPATISATIGNTGLFSYGLLPSSNFAASWVTWWMGDTLGALCLTPLAILLSNSRENSSFSLKKTILNARLPFLGCAVILAYGIFRFSPFESAIFLLLPLLLCAAMWFDRFTAILTSIAICIVSVYATAMGHGPFSSGTQNENLIHLQLFLASIAIAAVALPTLLVPKFNRLQVIVLLTGWFITAILFHSFRSNERSRDERRLDRMIEETQSIIIKKMTAYEDTLRAGAGFYAASKYVSYDEWRTFVSELDIGRRHPGINGVGIIYPVKHRDLDAFQTRIRKNEIKDFTVHFIKNETNEASTNRDSEHYVITYIHPKELNLPALGLDVGSEKNRRRAAELARDTGETAITQRIKLVQGTGDTSGFLLYLPFYSKTFSKPTSVEDRRKSLLGWIYAPFLANVFFGGVLPGKIAEIEFSVFDDSIYSPTNLFYQSKSAGDVTQNFTRKTQIEIGQKTFYFGWNRSSQFVSSHDTIGAWVGFCGTSIVLLLAGIIAVLQSTTVRANSIADERTRTIRKLEESNRSYKIMVQGIRDYAILMLDPEGRVQSWNEGMKRIKGYEEQEIIGENFSKFFTPPDLAQKVPTRLLETARAEGRAEHEGIRVRKDGTHFWAHTVINRINDNNGNLQSFVKLTQDLTERKERESAVADALLSLKLASAASKIGFFTFNIKTLKIEFTDEYIQIIGITFGKDRDENLSIFLDALDQNGRDTFITARTDFFRGKAPNLDLELHIKSPVHGPIWFRMFMHATSRDEDGKPVSVVGYGQDITEAKIVRDRINESERRLKHALEGSSDGLWDWDMVKGEMYVSEKLAEDLGGPSIVTITSESMAKTLHPDDIKVTLASIEDHLLGRSPKHEAQARLKMKDGQWKWFLTRGKISEFDNQGRPTRMTGVHIDISRLKKAEEDLETARRNLETSNTVLMEKERQLQKSNLELQSATTAKSQFLATMSHEIRTPLNGVLGMADLLSETPLTPDQSGLVRLVQQSGRSLLNIINDILDFSKIEAGKIEFEKITFSVKEAVEGQIALLTTLANEKQLFLETKIQPTLAIWRLGDTGRIGQILLNLLGNAVKFTQQGGVTVVVSDVSQQRQGQPYVRFEVRDTGIGLSPDQQKSLFQPFTQADSSTSRKYGGTGLGLSISKRLVEGMGGNIGVMSELEKGSLFWFELPLPHGDAPQSHADTQRQNAPSTTQNRPGTDSPIKILIAEDNQVNQVLARRLVEGLGYHCHIVANGIEALAALQQNHYNLILMDCQMPELDGYETTRQIRGDQNPTINQISIIALTANAMPGDEAKCREAGMNDYISKPLRKEKLKEKIIQWVKTI